MGSEIARGVWTTAGLVTKHVGEEKEQEWQEGEIGREPNHGKIVSILTEARFLLHTAELALFFCLQEAPRSLRDGVLLIIVEAVTTRFECATFGSTEPDPSDGRRLQALQGVRTSVHSLHRHVADALPISARTTLQHQGRARRRSRERDGRGRQCNDDGGTQHDNS